MNKELEKIKKKWWADNICLVFERSEWHELFDEIDELMTANDREILQLEERVKIDLKQITKSCGMLMEFCDIGGSTLTQLSEEAVKQLAEKDKEIADLKFSNGLISISIAKAVMKLIIQKRKSKDKSINLLEIKTICDCIFHERMNDE